jgi:DoxX-like protein
MTTPTPVQGRGAHNGPVISKTQLWAGRIMTGLAALFLLWDGVMKLVKPAIVVKATRDLGYPESEIVGIGLVLLACTLLYLFPRTSNLGAILLTGYLGGAIASQVRVEASWFNVVFAFVFACLVWGGLWLRDVRVRDFLLKS